MSINIPHLCRLAYIDLTPTEQTMIEADLGQIMALIDQMNAVNTDGVEPLAHALAADEANHQRLRADIVSETVDRQRFQAGAPQTADGLYLVPQVVESVVE